MSEVLVITGLVAIASTVAAVVAILVLTRLQRSLRKKDASALQPMIEQTVLLFDDEELIDATAPARTLLEASPLASSDWGRLVAFLMPRFETVRESLADLRTVGRLELTGFPGPNGGAPLRLLAEDVNGLTRVTLIDPEAEGQGLLVDGLSQRALEDELENLRHALDLSPSLVWQESAAGETIWANRAYLLRAGTFEEEEVTLSWPLPQIFQFEREQTEYAPRRLMLQDEDGIDTWFDCYSYRLGDNWMHFAQSADATVYAEKALRDFVQTLTKTFADLPIGLAIFNRQRQLQLFNPALSDLTALGVDFLSKRPTLYAFLDRLRETRMMAEPKDYRSWREQMTTLEKQAAAGYHSETWNLPNGQTYRVTGRPHPDGAIAFLFEDITSEMTLTRKFRSERDLDRSVLDNISEAVAVFLPSGELTSANAVYRALWPVQSAGMSLHDSLRSWADACVPTEIWSRARLRLGAMAEREPLTGEVTLRDGRVVGCRFVPLAGGALMASFAEKEALSTLEPLRKIAAQ
ncbi:PAS-domain containing protein [Thioclava sp. GXIMD4215]|uniref:PAS-domain containing protein n=1 Tax=Thioclava sp. GXIMD4215 TaxID=3131928 RepID=UPI00324F2347